LFSILISFNFELVIIPGEFILQPPLGYDPGVFLYMKRVTFLVDGFNLYYSIRDIKKLTKVGAKWF